MQRFIIVALLASVALTNANVEETKIVRLGIRDHRDSLIEQKDVKKTWLPWTVVTKDVTFIGDGRHKINCIEIYDLENKKPEETSKFHVVSGGTGETYVTLKFESSRGNRIHRLVKVYGVPTF